MADEGPPPPEQAPAKATQAPVAIETEDVKETEARVEAAVPLSDAISILKEPVDRLAMADSLFATREMRLALELYESIDAIQFDPEDRLWIWHQIGCCQRVLGDQAAGGEVLQDGGRFVIVGFIVRQRTLVAGIYSEPDCHRRTAG